MQHRALALAREGDGARAMGGEGAFELVASGGADEFAGLFGEEFVDGAGVLALDRLAGEDHRAAVDVAAPHARLLVGVVDEVIERMGVDGAVGDEGRQHDRRAPDHLAIGHHEAARQALGLALERDLGEEQVRRGAADVDAHRVQLDAFLTPDELRHLGLVGLGQLGVLMFEIDVVHPFHPWPETTVDRSAIPFRIVGVLAHVFPLAL